MTFQARVLPGERATGRESALRQLRPTPPLSPPAGNLPSGDVQLGAPGWILALYFTWIVVEYVGVAALVPTVKAIKLGTVLQLILILAVATRLRAMQPFRFRQTALLTTLVVMSIASVAWAEVQMRTTPFVKANIGYFLFFLVTLVVIDCRKRCDQLAALFSLVVLGLIATNFHKFFEGTRPNGFSGGYFLSDANDFAWGINVLAPFALYLAFSKRSILIRMVGLAAFCAAIIGIAGTQSRGGALALAGSLIYYWLVVSKRKIVGFLVLGALGLGLFLLGPGAYIQRLESISDYADDNSAVARLQVWRAAVSMARDYPLGVGAGNFGSAYGRFYKPAGEENSIVWGRDRWLNAHSVYFKMLGEHGLPGLVVFLVLLFTNLKRNHAAQNLLKANPAADLPPLWPAALNMSLVGYSVAGVFLGGVSYPHLFLLSALSVGTGLMASRASAEAPVAINAETPRVAFQPRSRTLGQVPGVRSEVKPAMSRFPVRR